MSDFDDIVFAKWVRNMRWGWSLERVSEEGDLEDRWIVWNEENIAIAEATTPDEAIENAFMKPLTDDQ